MKLLANYDVIATSFQEETFRVRNKEVHAYHQEAVVADVANGPVYGVLHKCPLLDLPYFDVTTAFVADIMHISHLPSDLRSSIEGRLNVEVSMTNEITLTNQLS